MSVWLCVLAVGLFVSVVIHGTVPCWPQSRARRGPQTTKLNELPDARGPVEVTAEPLSGVPFWSRIGVVIHLRYAQTCPQWSAFIHVWVSLPLPVLVTACG